MHVAPIPERVTAHSRWLSPVGGGSGVLKYLSFIIALFPGLVKVDYIPPCSRSVENHALSRDRSTSVTALKDWRRNMKLLPRYGYILYLLNS